MQFGLDSQSELCESLSKAEGLIKPKVGSLKEKDIAEVVRETILKGEQFKFTVKTGSMRPLLNLGDKVVVKKCSPNNLGCGDIIIYMIDYVSYVHRYIFKKKNGKQIFLVTKPDKTTYFNVPIPANNLVGKVIVVEKNRFNFNLGNIFWKTINRFLGIFSFLEGTFFNLLRLTKREIFNPKHF